MYLQFFVIAVTGDSPIRGNVNLKLTKGLPSTAKGLNLCSNRIAFATQKKKVVSFHFLFVSGRSDGIFACATIPDKQWVATVYPTGNLHYCKFSP